MPEEFALLKERFHAAPVRSIGPRDFLAASVGGREIVLVCSRVGKVAAASTATTLVQSFGVDALLMTGVAGGIAPEAGIGDIVVADTLIQHDIDLKGVMGCQRFDIPLLGLSAIPASSELLKIAAEAAHALVRSDDYARAVAGLAQRAPKAHCGVVASGDRFINESTERDELRRLIPRLMCVEMEGAAVAQVCAEHGVPLAVCRIISDSAGSGAVVDFQAFIERAAAFGSERFVAEFLARLP